MNDKQTYSNVVDTRENAMKIEYRQFACDKCGAIHQQQTNHEGQVYMQKCNNWPCTPGVSQYTSMSFWNGSTEEKETSFYRANDINNKVRMLFKQ